MRRIYFTNDSYPELRNIPKGWARHKAWFRAFRSAARDADLWKFFALVIFLVVACVELGVFAARYLPLELREYAIIGGLAAGMTAWCWLSVTRGGDLIRPHLRRTTPACGEACPECGYALSGHLQMVVNDHANGPGLLHETRRTGDAFDGRAATPHDEIPCPECGTRVPRECLVVTQDTAPDSCAEPRDSILHHEKDAGLGSG